MKARLIIFFFLILVYQSAVWAQTDSTESMTSTQFDTTDFPLWAKDLRRAEIIAFGTFPFTYLLIDITSNTYRSFTSGAGRTQDEIIRTLGYAAVGSVLLSIIDHGVMRYRRSILAKEKENLPEAVPIIIQKPLYEGSDEKAPERPAGQNSENIRRDR